MKTRRYCLVLALAAAIAGCDFPTLLSSEANDRQRENAPGAPMLFEVEITGGIAGVWQQLSVTSDGVATFSLHLRDGRQRRLHLSEEELTQWRRLFQQSQFFNLKDEYLSNVVDAFYYSITFYDQARRKTVLTDGFAGPDGLRRIVNALMDLQQKVWHNGLDLQLQLSQARIRAGDSVQITLLVANTRAEPVKLHFRTGQIFDFYAIPADMREPKELSRVRLWNWAHDKIFTQVLWELTLQAGESRSFQVIWDGRGNDGRQLTGSMLIGAELRSVPGGRPQSQALEITPANP